MVQQFLRRKFPYGFLIIICLIIIGLYLIFASLLALHLSQWGTPAKLLMLIPYHLIFLLLLWAIFESIRTDPGRVPFQWGFGMGAQEKKYCLLCHTFKPERTHHCNTCNRCVLNMDHHCPWINRCIGFYNRKAFILMLFYTTVITLLNFIIVVLCISPILEQAQAGAAGITGKIILTVIGTVINCIIFFAILNFLRFHINLILDNYTTLEILGLRRLASEESEPPRSPYDLGSYYNWLQVFGRNWVTWPIPVFLQAEGPSGDGVLWPKSSPQEEHNMI